MRPGGRGLGPRAVAGGCGAGCSVQPCLPSPFRSGDQRRAQKGCGFQEGLGGREGGVSWGRSAGRAGTVACGAQSETAGAAPPGLKLPCCPPPLAPRPSPSPGPDSAPSLWQPPRPPAPHRCVRCRQFLNLSGSQNPCGLSPAVGPGPLTPGLACIPFTLLGQPLSSVAGEVGSSRTAG